MTSIWHKAIRDFWQERRRTALVIIAIALGIAAFDAVLSSYAILTRELDRGYLETNPASAVLRVDSIDNELVAAVLQNQEVSDAEPRRTVSGQIKVGPVQWRNLILFVVKDYGDIRVSRLVSESGAWPPATGEILIERDAFQVAKASIGDAVTVKTANGVAQPLVISGRVHDVGQAQARMENMVYGYINLATLVQLGEEPRLDQLNILVKENRFDESHVRRVTSDVKALIESRGLQVRRVDVPKPGKHPHSELTGMLLLAMSSFGIFVLLLSGILVVNLITALMASQIRQIGVMKAVGGTRWPIAKIYFTQALLLGVAAIVVAIPLGLFGGRALCQYMAMFLNFDIVSYTVPIWVYLLTVLIGLATPLLAASYPVWKGIRIPVREALGDFGISQTNHGGGLLDRLFARLGGRHLPLVYALRNGFRRRVRVALTLLTLVAGGLFFLSALNVRASFVNTLDRLFATRKFDLTVNLGDTYALKDVERAIRDVPGVIQAEGWLTAEAFLPDSDSTGVTINPHDVTNSHAVASGGERCTVIALPSEAKLLVPEIVEGRNLLPGDTDAIVINSALAAKGQGIKVGSRIRLRVGADDTNWQIVGIAREAFGQATGYVLQNSIKNRHPGMVNNLRLDLDQLDPDSMARVKFDLDRNLERAGIRARSSTSQVDSRFSFDQHMLMIYIFLIVMSAIVGAVGGLGLMTTLSLNVLERRRELGILRAIGATPRTLWLIVVVEGLLIGLLSWLVAAIVAWPVSKALGNILVRAMFRGGLDFRFEPTGLLIWLIVSISLSVAASFLPAWKASRSTIREALAYE